MKVICILCIIIKIIINILLYYHDIIMVKIKYSQSYLILISYFNTVLSLPSIVISTVFDSEVSVVSYALWSRQNFHLHDWLNVILDDNTLLEKKNVYSIMTIALVGIHTHQTGHLYKDFCSENTFEIQYHPKKHISECSYYIKGQKSAKFYPILKPLNHFNTSDIVCSFFKWSIGVSYILCPLDNLLGYEIENNRMHFNLHSARHLGTKCQNPISINFTTESAALRRKVLPPVNLSVCIYSGFRPHKNTRFHNLLEANIEYHRKLGVQRFYILDRNYSHKDLFDRHKSDWIDTGLVSVVQYTVGELLNINTMQVGGFRDQVVSLPLCTHEHHEDKWMLVIDKDEFFTCKAEVRKSYQKKMYSNQIAYNVVNSLNKSSETHMSLIRINRGPKVNKQVDCINGGYPTADKYTAGEISQLDRKMNRKVHHRYYEISTESELNQLNISYSPLLNKQSNSGSYTSYFEEFTVYKANFPNLGKVIQQSNKFPFTDIHGWTHSQQNKKKMLLLKKIKKVSNKANIDCHLWHFNPKWDSWFRGICKNIHRTIDVNEEELMPKLI